MSTSIAECRAAGVVFEAGEAVAIAQQLITSLRDSLSTDELHTPYGPPSAENVFLEDNGSVACRGCRMTPVVSEVAIFLEDLLPPGSPRVPGGLRYTMARALLNVDVPPFDSVDDFSRDLARHERGNRVTLVRSALARAGRPIDLAPVPVVDRRRSPTSATTLRRELRDADVRLYQGRDLVNAEPAAIDIVPMPPPPQRGRTLTATAACVAAGLVLIGAGELMHKARTPAPAPTTIASQAPAAPAPDTLRQAQTSVPDEPAATPAPLAASPTADLIAVRETTTKPPRASRPEVRRVSYKRTSSAPAAGGKRSAKKPANRSMLDRLRLGWLRNVFGSRSSL
jgi:hypothetical protein